MFTGIIEEVGVIKGLQRGSRSARIEVAADAVLQGTRLGDSIATDGVCLTVVSLTARSFTADVMHETLSRCNLGNAAPGRRVNLERAMPADGRFGGHIVSGHIDGTGRVAAILPDDNAYRLTVECESVVLKYIIEKGSICINGISLTVASVSDRGFEVSIIPHTWSQTTLGGLKTGDTVNLENDIVGKYVERFLTYTPSSAQVSTLTEDYLREHGF